MKKIVLLGASGSIGEQVMDIVREHPDEFSVVALSVGKRVNKLADYLNEFEVPYACVQFKEDLEKLSVQFPKTKFFYGDDGLLELAKLDCDLFINSLVGFAGVAPTLCAIECGHTIGLANKETLVAAGDLVCALAKEKNVSILPIDSEHSAIFQCLKGSPISEVERLIITASGGSFRNRSREELVGVTVEDALSHPNWSMGAKITIDSATMMNKGFEVIEARYLFDLPYEKIDTVLHKESIIHSFVEFKDHSILAQLGQADMRIPIQVAMAYPNRLDMKQENRLDLVKMGSLHFEELSFERYPLLGLAYEAGKQGGILPCVMNAANEVAVARFLNGEIEFLDIERIVCDIVRNTKNQPVRDLSQLIEINEEIRRIAKTY